MSEEWGPWSEHDGGPRPVPRGTFCHVLYEDGDEVIGPVGVGFDGRGINTELEPWGDPVLIVRYRIRKPRGLTILEGLLEELPEKVAS